MAQLHRNKTGTATVTPNGEATNPRWSIDKPEVCGITPNGFSAQLLPISNGTANLTFKFDGASQDIILGGVVEVVDPPASDGVMTIVENP